MLDKKFMIKRDKSEREKNERKAEMETHRNQNIKKKNHHNDCPILSYDHIFPCLTSPCQV